MNQPDARPIAPRKKTRWTPLTVWAGGSMFILTVSLTSGYVASRMAGAPKYLLTKTHDFVDVPYEPANAEEAAEEAAFRDAGNERSTIAVSRPMYVLGLLDGALPAILFSGVICGAWAMRRRRLEARRRRAYHTPDFTSQKPT